MKILRADIGFYVVDQEILLDSFHDYIENLINMEIFSSVSNLSSKKGNIERNKYYRIYSDFSKINGAIVKIDDIYVALDDYDGIIYVEEGEVIVRCHTVAVRRKQCNIPEINIYNSMIKILKPLN